jgi:PAS domain S-box-containing protein
MINSKILIVEDESILALDLQSRLKGHGFTTPVIALTGEEAIRRAAEVRPDLVLMDIMLPGEIDGVTAAEEIKSQFDIPVVYVTAYADEDTLQRAKITEPYGYIIKPYRERELVIAIEMALFKYKIEKKLKESEKWLATIVRSIGDAVIIVDNSSLITFMNKVAEELTGWRMEEVFNRRLINYCRIINRSTRQPLNLSPVKVLLDGTVKGPANHKILIARNGTEIPVDESMAPMKDEQGNVIGAVLVFRDTTEREQAEEELRKAYEELKQKNLQLEMANRELDSFSYSVSHDLRAPLRAIDGFSQMLLKDIGDKLDPDSARKFNIISSNSKKMGQLIDDLLQLSRTGRAAIQFDKINLKSGIEDVWRELRAVNPERNMELLIGELPIARGNRMLLRQVLSNILGNAVKFTKGREKAIIEVSGSNSGEFNTYCIKDNGAGFDMRYYDRLFEIFRRLHTESEFEGTGVGLAIVKKIIDKHGGRIWAEGKPGEGAIFYFTLRTSI